MILPNNNTNNRIVMMSIEISIVILEAFGKKLSMLF
ncbi:Uncharacterised protein [Chryseobacterium carnipullorum]|uniref:Uncharacterized protein n=1 Tax=Chryseobacterium carnipullorum TaxID=1124835 RepID=A0A376DZ76_CHRCU|nr:Uncharacterised protein [Chryseobacterium carnipullorum]